MKITIYSKFNSKINIVFLCLLLCWFNIAHSKILVISPHPDDDIIIASGIVYAAKQRGEEVTIVYMTNGDATPSVGEIRQLEAVQAQTGHLGTTENDLIFLGYPDGNLANLYQNFPNQTDRFLGASSGQTSTYASHGLGGTDYHHYRFGTHASYNKFNMLTDLTDIINLRRPDHIVTVMQADQHTDHQATYNLTRDAILAVSAANANYIPVLNTMLVWSINSNIWPEPSSPNSYFNEPPNFTGTTGYLWTNRESLDVPLEMQTTGVNLLNLKKSAINSHASQGGNLGFIGQFLHKDEFYWPITLTGNNSPPRVDAGVNQIVLQGSVVTLNGSKSRDPNGSVLTYQWRQIAGTAVNLTNSSSANPTFVAPSGLSDGLTLAFELIVSDGRFNSLADHVSVRVQETPITPQNIANIAVVTASSEGANQQARKAVDGIAEGYPNDSSKEWSTIAQGANSWLELNWSINYRLNRVVLYDRPNTDDQITSATLTFSDGSTVSVGALDNAGSAVTIDFPPTLSSRIRMTVTTVSGTTQNVGLSEIEVYTTDNLPPTAHAGPDQIVTAGNLVVLDGRQSDDPNGDPITYQWTRTAGPSVTVSDANTSIPQFTAPAVTSTSVLTFRLVVSDGSLTSLADTVNVTVSPNQSSRPIASLSPNNLTFNDQYIGTTSTNQAVTLSNTGNSPLSIASIVTTAQFTHTHNCGSTISAGANCRINVAFSPAATSTINGTLTVTSNSNNVAGSTQSIGLSGMGIPQSTAPTLSMAFYDDFNRANANNLGSKWIQSSFFGAATLRIDNGQIRANYLSRTGYAFSNLNKGSVQAAGFTLAASTVNNTALFLKATGAFGSSGQYENAIRIRYSSGQIRIATTNNGNNNSPSYSDVGSSISTGENLVIGNTLIAAVGSNGLVWVWKNVNNTLTLLTPIGIQLPNSALWTTGGGKIGVQVPNNGRIDNVLISNN